MTLRLAAVFLLAWTGLSVGLSTAQVTDEALAQRIKQLETELRCPKCQNQTLADSPAGVAGDLRREIHRLAEQGKSDDDIKQYLQARYGDFVLYKPPVKRETWLLWFGPFALLLIGLISMIVINRRRAAMPQAAALSEAEKKRAENLLE